ncbi:MAG: hypothetical protein AB7V18_17940 [Pyrinomonadaceae bacterium]
MRIVLSLYLLLFGVHFSGCSKGIEGDNAAPSSPKPTENAVLPSAVNLQDTPGAPVESSSPNPGDVVLFDGKYYKKKSGWKTPPKNDTYIDESYDQGSVEGRTEKGKQVRTNTLLYGYRTSWWHSQDFYYEGRDLDYLKGKLESLSFMETSVNGKVFMYSITVGPLILNDLDHKDPFGYRIQDRDGDGIFETLLPRDADVVVSDWVLK